MTARDSDGPKARMTPLEAASHAVAVRGNGSSPENRSSDLPTILKLRMVRVLCRALVVYCMEKASKIYSVVVSGQKLFKVARAELSPP